MQQIFANETISIIIVDSFESLQGLYSTQVMLKRNFVGKFTDSDAKSNVALDTLQAFEDHGVFFIQIVAGFQDLLTEVREELLKSDISRSLAIKKRLAIFVFFQRVCFENRTLC